MSNENRQDWTAHIIFRVHQLFKDKKLKELQLSKISKCLMELVGHENDITLSLGKFRT